MDRILIVDDEPDMVEVLELVLRRRSDCLLKAYDGVQALELVQRHRPKLVLADVALPGLDGAELCRRIRAHRATRDTPVVLITAVDRVQTLDSGANEVLYKPFSVRYLLATVDRYLSLSGEPGRVLSLPGGCERKHGGRKQPRARPPKRTLR